MASQAELLQLPGESAAAAQGQAPKKKRIRRQSAIDKKEKGLRHFAVRVCQKVESKVTTTYNEVADELVQEVLAPSQPGEESETDRQYDEKNIRRRVYDALNVLLAMDIIEKKKKEIRWRGLPDGTSSVGLELHTPETLRAEVKTRRGKLEAKEKHLAQLHQHDKALKQLVQRNAEMEMDMKFESAPDSSTVSPRVELPFLLVDAKQGTSIELQIHDKGEEVTFTMTGPFDLHDDMDILRSMGLHKGPGFAHACISRKEEATLARPVALSAEDVVHMGAPIGQPASSQQDFPPVERSPTSTDLLLMASNGQTDSAKWTANPSGGGPPSPNPELDSLISPDGGVFPSQTDKSNAFIRVSN